MLRSHHDDQLNKRSSVPETHYGAPLALSGVSARRRIDPRRGGHFLYPPTGETRDGNMEDGT